MSFTRNESVRPTVRWFLVWAIIGLIAWWFETSPRAITITPPSTGTTSSGQNISSAFCGYLLGAPGTNSTNFGMFKPDVNVKLTNISCADDVNPVGCTTSARIEPVIGGTAQGLLQCNFANGTNGCSASGVSLSAAAGTAMNFQVFQAEAGCTTAASNINCCGEFTTQ